MNWIVLFFAGLCEVGFTYCLGRAKEVVGSEWWSWIAAFSFFYVLSAVLLARATQTIALGIAYPVWTGIGAAGAVIIGIFIFREPASFWRLFFLTNLIDITGQHGNTAHQFFIDLLGHEVSVKVVGVEQSQFFEHVAPP